MCILLSFEDLGGQTKACMVGDMTVHEPVARIIGLECDNDETVFWQENDVTSRRVLEIGLVVAFGKWFVLLLLENSKVVSMKMYLQRTMLATIQSCDGKAETSKQFRTYRMGASGCLFIT
jgi:hypothetical protein